MTNIIQSQEEEQPKEDPTEEPLGPLCACGCGLRTKYNKSTCKFPKYCNGHRYYPHPTKKYHGPLCACGCGQQVKYHYGYRRYNKYINGHRYQKCIDGCIVPIAKKHQLGPLCACGCGQHVKYNTVTVKFNKFIKGHNIISMKAIIANVKANKTSLGTRLACFRAVASMHGIPYTTQQEILKELGIDVDVDDLSDVLPTLIPKSNLKKEVMEEVEGLKELYFRRVG